MSSKRSQGPAGDAHAPVIENRKARFDYAILETLETGMSLTGSEVKSIRDGKVSLAEGFVKVEAGPRTRGPGAKPAAKPTASKPGKTASAKPKPIVPRGGPLKRPGALGLFLHQVNIAEYAPAGPPGSVGQHVPTRVRQLLAHRREIAKLAREVEVKGMTLVPLKIYFVKGKAKLLIGLARGKTHADKRDSIAKRDAQRDIARAMSKRV